jgi:hypothetical protein
MHKTILGSLLLVAVASTGIAQPGSGDLIVACMPPGHGLYRVARSGKTEAILSSAAQLFPNAVCMWPDNRDLAVAIADPGSSYRSNPLMRVGPGGLALTIALIQPGPPNDLAGSENGSLLVFPASQNAVLEVTLDGSRVTTLATLPAGALNAGIIAPDDGRLLLAAYWHLPQGGVFAASGPGPVSTLIWGIGRISGLSADRLRGDVVVTRFDGPEVLRLDREGRATSLLRFPGANTVAVEGDGTIWIAGGNALTRVSASGVPLGTIGLPGIATDLEIYGRRILSGQGRAAAGGRYRLPIHSLRPGDGGRPYVLAASTALRPSIAIGDGRRLAIGPSPLLAISVTGGLPFFHGFHGVLDPFGRATAAIDVPHGLSGLRIHVAGVILDPQENRVSTLMNTISFTIR